MKRIFSLLLILCLSLSMLSLTACSFGGDSKESKVMTVSCNPEVEFILDVNGNVVSINALNEEGNMIVSAQTNVKTFAGKTAEDAAQMFVEIAQETGFLIKGDANMAGNTINISISGNVDSAKKIYESAKTSVQNKLTELGLNTKIANFASLADTYLKEKVQKAESYFSETEINALSYSDLIAKLENSRKETANMLSQELKETYYQIKENAVNKAKIEEATKNFNALSKAAISLVQSTYDTACNTLIDLKNTLLVNSNSAYQLALAQFRSAKAEYLNFRAYLSEQANVTKQQQDILDGLNTALDTAESALTTAYNTAIDGLNTAQTAINTAYNAVVSAITNISAEAESVFNTTTDSVITAVSNAKTQFSTTYSQQISDAQDAWTQFKNDLIAGYTPAE